MGSERLLEIYVPLKGKKEIRRMCVRPQDLEAVIRKLNKSLPEGGILTGFSLSVSYSSGEKEILNARDIWIDRNDVTTRPQF